VPVATGAVRHTGRLYRTVFRKALSPLRKVEEEARHLHEIEAAGESPETPLIAILGVVLFLLPIVLLICGLVFAAYYLAA
jgi:hypothetical protein